MSVRVNIGCGRTPTEGWTNCDNSWSVRLAAAPPSAVRLLARLGVVGPVQLAFIEESRKARIRHVDATRGLDFADSSVDALYTSHMLEHLDEVEARDFLRDAYRVLRPGGVLRVVVPDIQEICR